MIVKTIKNRNISTLTKQTHEVEIPSLSPKTNNPIQGSTLIIIYAPEEELLEFYRLNEYVTAFIGSNEVRDLELFAQVAARDCREALGVRVKLIGKFILNIGQTLFCECKS
jgi:hypothetical protein